MAHEGYHEPIDRLSPATMDFHRAIQSLIEELEAVDWYNQRVDACADPELRAILFELRDEEAQHEAWVRSRLEQLPPGPDLEEDEADEPGMDPGN